MYFTLFSASFLAATLLPFPSEATLLGVIAAGYDPFYCILVASLGNCCGVTLNYVGGRGGGDGSTWLVTKVFGFDEKKIDHYRVKFEAHGFLLVLASWLPGIGDPITIYLGISRYPFQKFVVFVYGLRVLRYIVIYLLMELAI